ncbi:MAG: hypothetical protein ACI4KG_02310 [Oscillospiraceae bacterium]
MFKKRLKGLLAMMLAGSMTLTMLPMTASATFNSTVTIYGGDLNEQTISADDLDATGFTGGVLSTNTEYLTEDNLWGLYYSKDGTESGDVMCSVTGYKLAQELYGKKESGTQYTNMKARYSHKVLVTTQGSENTTLYGSDASDITSFPASIALGAFVTNDPMKDYSRTVFYGVDFGDGYGISILPKYSNPHTIETGSATI